MGVPARSGVAVIAGEDEEKGEIESLEMGVRARRRGLGEQRGRNMEEKDIGGRVLGFYIYTGKD